MKKLLLVLSVFICFSCSRKVILEGNERVAPTYKIARLGRKLVRVNNKAQKALNTYIKRRELILQKRIDYLQKEIEDYGKD